MYKQTYFLIVLYSMSVFLAPLSFAAEDSTISSCPMEEPDITIPRYGDSGNNAKIQIKLSGDKVSKACIQSNKKKRGWTEVVCGTETEIMTARDKICCAVEMGEFAEEYKWITETECNENGYPIDDESFCSNSKDSQEFGCEVVGFELPQEISGNIGAKATEWIFNYGDPQYLAYWQKWPSGEENAWMGLMDWAQNKFVIFVTVATTGIVTGCTYKMLEESKAVKSLSTSIKTATPNAAVKVVGKSSDIASKSASQIASWMGLKSAKGIGKGLVIGGAVATGAGYIVATGAEVWIDSILYKLEREQGNTLFLIKPGKKEYPFVLQKAEDYHVILERSVVVGGPDVSFYSASPCKVDLEVKKYPDGSKYTCGVDLAKCGIYADGAKWYEKKEGWEMACDWTCNDAQLKLDIKSELKECGNEPDYPTKEDRQECFDGVITSHSTDFENCGCIIYYTKGFIPAEGPSPEEVCGGKQYTFYENKEYNVNYCMNLHGTQYFNPFKMKAPLDVIGIKDVAHYPEYGTNYCYATETKVYTAFKILDLGATYMFGWHPGSKCGKNVVVSVIGAGIFTKLDKITKWPGHAGW